MPAHGQAESRPLAFGGEEGGEHVGAFRFRDGGSVVADLNHHVVVCRAVGFAGDVPGPVADGLRRIADQVEQHLAYQLLVGIEHEVGGAGVAIPCDVWRHEGQGLDFREQFFHIEQAGERSRQGYELAAVLHEVAQSVRCVMDDPQAVQAVLPAGLLFFRQGGTE